MRHEIPVISEYDAREWCIANNVEFIYVYAKGGSLVLQYDDGKSDTKVVSQEENDYYARIADEMFDEKPIKKWIIYSDDGINSRMYKGVGRTTYTFYVTEAKIYNSQSEAERTARSMTLHSKVGRIWHAARV